MATAMRGAPEPERAAGGSGRTTTPLLRRQDGRAWDDRGDGGRAAGAWGGALRKGERGLFRFWRPWRSAGAFPSEGKRAPPSPWWWRLFRGNARERRLPETFRIEHLERAFHREWRRRVRQSWVAAYLFASCSESSAQRE